ncbi:jupiter microtubule associated homolog 2-like isoform X2 [Physella acuta]|uniref:jupiter microtubule associated homolog 2-like isoform X2 n=1 Tax=Physella acuta TaxID=109671 RepID=UPI0027DC3FA3|nr:jupiter microtubule associated homolog 2-like isoform X2 [Physella acuta]
MTTTSTFQGMNTDSKPSSRVLNPPGGASSNIFGGYEDNTPAQRTPIKNNPDNVNRGNNDIFHQGSHPEAVAPHIRNNPDNVNRGSSDIFNQGPHASASAPNKNSRAPRSGELYEQAPKNKPEPYNTGVTSHHAEGDCQVEQESVPTTDTKAQASGQASQQNQGGIFGGGASDSQDHRSTRVSQPPGGRSTKLW